MLINNKLKSVRRPYLSSTHYSFSEYNNGVLIPEARPNKSRRRDTDNWLYNLINWDKLSLKNTPKLKEMVRRGIPPSIRAEAWKVISGARFLKSKSPGVYEQLVTLNQSSQSEACLIKDLHRTFPHNNMFKTRESFGQKALYNVLKVFSIMDPEVGYCQGMSFICGILIQNGLSEVDAFWVLVSLLKTYNFRGLFLSELPLLKHFLFRFHFLVQKYLPDVFSHFLYYGIRPLYYSAEWFSTLFSYTFAIETTSRIWDVLLVEGPNFLFRVALAILKTSKKDLLNLDFDGIMLYLKNTVWGIEVLHVADEFNGVEEEIVEIDNKFETLRDLIMAGYEEALAPSDWGDDHLTEYLPKMKKSTSSEEVSKSEIELESKVDGESEIESKIIDGESEIESKIIDGESETESKIFDGESETELKIIEESEKAKIVDIGTERESEIAPKIES